MIIGLKHNMVAFQDLVGLAQMADSVWTEVEAPKNHRQPPPKREIALFSEITTWDACKVPLSGLVIRDHYPKSEREPEGKDKGKEEWRIYVSTKGYAKASDFYARQRLRWEEEESFMALSRYWGANDLPPLREGVARAVVHFTLLAYLLLGLFRHLEARREASTFLPPLIVPEVELAVYAGKHYALLTASELLTIVFENLAAWQKHSHQILASLRLAERKLDSS